MSFTINKKRYLSETCKGLGAQLKSLREQRGWSLEETCAQVGLVNPRILQQVEEGKVKYPFLYLRLIVMYQQKIIVTLQPE